MNILIVSPHHDDEVIGCGGSIAKASANGHKIGVIYLTAGYSGLPNIKNAEEATHLRELEAQKAGNILGISDFFFLKLPDRETTCSFEVIAKLVKIFRKYRVEVVLSPHPQERDREHRIAYKLTNEAAWLSANNVFPELGQPIKIQKVYLYEVWTPLQKYHRREDISGFINLKKQALRCYNSQFIGINTEKLLGLNYYRAALNQKNGCVEVFQLD